MSFFTWDVPGHVENGPHISWCFSQFPPCSWTTCSHHQTPASIPPPSGHFESWETSSMPDPPPPQSPSPRGPWSPRNRQRWWRMLPLGSCTAPSACAGAWAAPWCPAPGPEHTSRPGTTATTPEGPSQRIFSEEKREPRYCLWATFFLKNCFQQIGAWRLLLYQKLHFK